MGFLVKKKEQVDIPKEKTREELRNHNLEVIEKYKKELETTSEIFLVKNEQILRNAVTNESEFTQIEELLAEQAPVGNKLVDEEIPSKSLTIEKIDGDLEEIKAIEKVEEEDLMAQFEEEMGKHAIWRGKMTKAFEKWKENRLKK